MHRPPSIIEGWDIERQQFRDAHARDELVKLVTEFSNACTLNCPGCFTVKLDDEEEIQASLTKQRLRGEMSSGTRMALLEEAVALGAKSVDIVGAGEPMIDPHLKPFVERAATLGVHVNIFTHGAHKELLEPDRLEWWRERPVSFVVKLWSQNPAVNEAMVRPKGRLQGKYTTLRDQALTNLIEAGFTTPTELEFDGRTHRRTRVGADILVTKANYEEIERLFRFCRENNIMPEIKNYIPQGPSKLVHNAGSFNALPQEVREELERQRVNTADMQKIRERLTQIDKNKFGNPPLNNIYAGGTFCTQSMAGLYVSIGGQIYSCVGTGNSYGTYLPGAEMLKIALRSRKERVGFGCFPRLVAATEQGDPVPGNERAILNQV